MFRKNLFLNERRWEWNTKDDQQFGIKRERLEAGGTKRFNKKNKVRKICDGLGMILLEEKVDGCKPIACSSRRLNTLEDKKTKKDPALLSFVWLVTCSRN